LQPHLEAVGTGGAGNAAFIPLVNLRHRFDRVANRLDALHQPQVAPLAEAHQHAIAVEQHRIELQHQSLSTLRN